MGHKRGSASSTPSTEWKSTSPTRFPVDFPTVVHRRRSRATPSWRARAAIDAHRPAAPMPPAFVPPSDRVDIPTLDPRPIDFGTLFEDLLFVETPHHGSRLHELTIVSVTRGVPPCERNAAMPASSPCSDTRRRSWSSSKERTTTPSPTRAAQPAAQLALGDHAGRDALHAPHELPVVDDVALAARGDHTRVSAWFGTNRAWIESAIPCGLALDRDSTVTTSTSVPSPRCSVMTSRDHVTPHSAKSPH